MVEDIHRFYKCNNIIVVYTTSERKPANVCLSTESDHKRDCPRMVRENRAAENRCRP